MLQYSNKKHEQRRWKKKTNAWTLRSRHLMSTAWVCEFIRMNGSSRGPSDKSWIKREKKKLVTNSAKHQIEWRIMEILHILMTLHLSFLSIHCRCWPMFTTHKDSGCCIPFFSTRPVLRSAHLWPDFFFSVFISFTLYLFMLFMLPSPQHFITLIVRGQAT